MKTTKYKLINLTGLDLSKSFGLWANGSRKGKCWTIGHPLHYKRYAYLHIRSSDLIDWESIKGFEIRNYGKVKRLVPEYNDGEWDAEIVFALSWHRQMIYPEQTKKQEEITELLQDFLVGAIGYDILHQETRYCKHFIVFTREIGAQNKVKYCGPRSGWEAKGRGTI